MSLFVTVGMPSSDDGSIDLKCSIHASNAIGKALKKKNRWHLVIVKSTVIPGTTGTTRSFKVLTAR